MRLLISWLVACAIGALGPGADDVLLYRLIDPHEELEDTPELTATDGEMPTLYVTPPMYPNWAAMLAANTSILRFKMLGNFKAAGWGQFQPTQAQGGIVGVRRVIMHPDAHVAPWERPASQALIDGFIIGEGNGNPSSHWILHGLTTQSHTTENSIRMGSTDVVVDLCWVRDARTYGIRGLLYAHDCVVQRCVMEGNPNAIAGDVPGVQLRIPNDGEPAKGGSSNMHGWRIVNCQIYNFPDSIAVTHAVDNIPTPGGLGDGIINGTVIAGCDFYTTPDLYTVDGKAPTENALDLKGGSSDPSDPVRVIDNRMHGFRFSTIVGGSDGAAVVVHNWSRNYYFGRNVMYDCPVGARVDVWPTGQPQVARGIVFEENVFHGIRPFAAGDAGKAIHARLPMTLRRNAFVHVTTIHNQAMLSGQPEHTMEHNVRVDAPLGTAATPWATGPGNYEMSERLAGNLLVDHEPWTGPLTELLDHGGALMTATTTLGAIRENMETRLVAFTPATQPGRTFTRHRGNMKFRAWCELNPADCFRKFQLIRVGEIPTTTSSDNTTRVRAATLELVIAYPRDWARVSAADEPDVGPVEDVIEEDQKQLDSRTGIGLDSYGFHLAGHHSARIAWSQEDLGDKVILCIGRIDVAYYEGV